MKSISKFICKVGIVIEKIHDLIDIVDECLQMKNFIAENKDYIYQYLSCEYIMLMIFSTAIFLVVLVLFKWGWKSSLRRKK
jgi:hypothetical protein